MFGIADVYCFSAVFIGCGLFSLAYGLREYLRWRALVRRGVKTVGVAKAHEDDDGGVALTAVFRDERGVSYKVYSRGGDSAWKALDGQEVEVLFEPGRPKTARLVVDLSLRAGLGIYWFGLLFSGIGLVALVLHFFGIEVVTSE